MHLIALLKTYSLAHSKCLAKRYFETNCKPIKQFCIWLALFIDFSHNKDPQIRLHSSNLANYRELHNHRFANILVS
ncbi:hypothetical protein ACTXT7_015550 [Hymenolepis weldensis]